MFAAIHVPDFSVDAVVRHEPDLREKALAIVDGRPPLWNVVAVNARARRDGIEPGMTRLQVEQFFDAAIRKRSGAQEAAAHAAMLDCAGACSPRVEDTSLDTAVVDIAGMNHLLGSAAELAESLAGDLARLGLAASIAVASNPDTAVCAARGRPGITIIEHGAEAGSLKPLDIAFLPMPPETCDTLLRWGIRTFGALAALPVKSLSQRLGQAGVYLHELASGRASRPLVPRKSPLHFEESIELDYTVTALEPLTFLLNRLADALFKRLQSRGLAALEMRLTLISEPPHEPAVVPLQMPVPARNPRIAVRLFMMELEARPPGKPVVGLRLAAAPSKPRIIQSGLFVPLSPEPEKLALTLSRIAALVGSENVGTPRLHDSWGRDRFDMKRPEGLESSEAFDKEAAPASASSPASPAARIFRPALEATVRMQDGAPAWIAFAGMHGCIESAGGPWRSSGEWWESHWSREEWDVAVFPEAGSRMTGTAACTPLLFRIVLNVLTGRWYVEGIYD